MDRRQLLFVVLLNSLVSLAIAVTVVWVAELRRPDPEELAVQYTPLPPVVLVASPTAEAAPTAQPTLPAAGPTTTPAVTLASAPTASGEQEIYVVQEGDSLFAIALRNNLSVAELMEANNLTDPDYVFSGQRLIIPGGAATGASTAETPSVPQPSPGLTLQVEQPGNLAEERVLIVNESNDAANLQGWTLGDISGPVYEFGNLPLFPGSAVRLHTESGEDDSLNLYWQQASALWESGDVVRLFDAEGREIASYTVP